jgi:hypothetical protein
MVMASAFDLEREKEKNRRFAVKALEDSRTYLEQIQKRVAAGEDVDQRIIRRLIVNTSQLESVTESFIR